MKKTLHLLSCLTILSACGTDNKIVSERHAPELNNATPHAKPQTRAALVPQSNKYTALPFLGNSLIPAPPPVMQARAIVPPPPVQPPMQVASSNIPAAVNSNAGNVPSADLLGPAPSPVVTRTPLAPLPPMAAPPAPSGPVQKIQSVALNMPQGSVIPQAPGKNAKALIEIPAKVAVVKPAAPEIHDVAALPPVGNNMPQGSVVPTAPAKSAIAANAPQNTGTKSIVVSAAPETREVAALPPVAANMPQGSVVPNAPGKPIVVVAPEAKPEPEPEIREVAALPPVAAYMPQGTIFPPVPPVAKAPEPEVHEVEQLQPSSVIMPQGSYSVVPSVTEEYASTAADVQAPPVSGSKLIAQASDASVAERIPVEAVPQPISEMKPPPPAPITVASNSAKSYDQYPNLADIPPAPPTPGPASADPRVAEMKEQLQVMQSAAPAPMPEPKPIAKAPEPVVAAAPPPPPPPAPKAEEPLLPKGPTIVIKSDSDTPNAEAPAPEPMIAAAPPPPAAPPMIAAAPPPPAPIVAAPEPMPVAAAAVKTANSGPGKPAGFLVPPTVVQTIHEGASTTNANSTDNNFENVLPMSEEHNGLLPATRYERYRSGETN